MRRHRPARYPLAFLTVAIGIAAGPSAVGAGADTVTPVDDVNSAPEPAAVAPVDEPPAPPTTQAPPQPESPAGSPVTESRDTVPQPGASTPEAMPAPHPEHVPAVTNVLEPEPSAPATESTTTTITPSPVVELTEPTPLPEAEDGDELDVDVSDPLSDVSVVRPIAFPVLGPVQYSNDWGNCRDGCARRHQGTDMIGVRMQPLLAAVDGTVTRIRYENVGTAGTVISITGADGWYYNYFHVNNDTPGTDDGAAGPEWQVAPPLTVGSPVRAGQVIGYMGDSGNAESSVPHLHFEIRQPDRRPVNPYPSLVAAQERQTCVDTAPVLDDAASLSDAAVAVIPLTGGGRWLIDRDGVCPQKAPPPASIARLGIACEVVQPVVEGVNPLVQPADPVAAAVVAGAGTGEPDPAAAAATPWTVERGQSLWTITQSAYGVSESAANVSLVNFVFDHNRNVLADPDVLEIGMILQLPPLAWNGAIDS